MMLVLRLLKEIAFIQAMYTRLFRHFRTSLETVICLPELDGKRRVSTMSAASIIRVYVAIILT